MNVDPDLNNNSVKKEAIIIENDDGIFINNDSYNYSSYDIRKGHIYRQYSVFDSLDVLPDAIEFMKVWDKPKKTDTFEFKITNENETGIIVLSAGPGIMLKNDVIAIPPNRTYKFIACVFNVEPNLIGVVHDNRDTEYDNTILETIA